MKSQYFDLKVTRVDDPADIYGALVTKEQLIELLPNLEPIIAEEEFYSLDLVMGLTRINIRSEE